MRMVEKMARAICDGFTNGNATLDDVSDRDRYLYVEAARSAIAAMREPTEDMASIGSYDVVDPMWRPDGAYRIFIAPAHATAVFTAMIDKAIQESGE